MIVAESIDVESVGVVAAAAAADVVVEFVPHCPGM